MNEDTGKTIAIVALIGSATYGIYKWVTRSKLYGWVLLQTVILPIKVSFTYGWVPLKETILLIKTSLIGGWVLLKQTTLLVKASLTYAWVLLDTVSFTVTVAPVPQFYLTLVVEPFAWGTIDINPENPQLKYGEGQIVELTAIYDPAWYAFSYWDVDGEWLGTSNPINFMVMADHTITAHFVLV